MLFTLGPVGTFEQVRDFAGWVSEQRASSDPAGADAAQATAPPAVEPTSECGQMVAWADATRIRNKRLAEVETDIYSLDPTSFDPNLIRSWANELDGISREQRLSDPPPMAHRANDILVETNHQVADLFRVSARAFVVTPTAAEQAQLLEQMEETLDLFEALDAENQRLTTACGAQFYVVSIPDVARTATAGSTREAYSCDGFDEWVNNPDLAIVGTALDEETGNVFNRQFLRLARGEPVDATRLREIADGARTAVAALETVEPPPVARRTNELFIEVLNSTAQIADELIRGTVDKDTIDRQQAAIVGMAAEFEAVRAQCL
jgi:hypothetical protein